MAKKKYSKEQLRAIHAKRPYQAHNRDGSQRAQHTYPDTAENRALWVDNPRRVDIEGLDTPSAPPEKKEFTRGFAERSRSHEEIAADADKMAKEWIDGVTKDVRAIEHGNEALFAKKDKTDRYKESVASGKMSRAHYDAAVKGGDILAQTEWDGADGLLNRIEDIKSRKMPRPVEWDASPPHAGPVYVPPKYKVKTTSAPAIAVIYKPPKCKPDADCIELTKSKKLQQME